MLSVVSLLVVTVGLTVALPTTPEPPNGIRQCARSECPVYEVLENYGSGMIKRRVEGGLWPYKIAPTCNISQATGSVYMSLHYYFRDNNISRTTPIMLRIQEKHHRPSSCADQPDACPCCDEQYTLFFYVPRTSQATAPNPTEESGVQLSNVSMPQDFYVISFHGRASYKNGTQKHTELVDYLTANNLSFCEETYFYASYDAPWRPQPHRSEVLIPAKPCDTDGDDDDGDKDCNEEGDEDHDQHDHEGEDHYLHKRDSGNLHRDGRRQRREVDSLSDVDLIPY